MSILWFVALTFLLPFAVGSVLGVLYGRSADLAQLRRWAREDGLRHTRRRELVAHYRNRGLWP